jgi:Holliday junction DNA helicase RuvA
MKPAEIQSAIVQGNAKLLESIKGIGKKSAERIILELRDKITKISTGLNNDSLIHNTLESDALNALISLGISRTVAEQAVSRVRKTNPDSENIEDIIKKALQNI